MDKITLSEQIDDIDTINDKITMFWEKEVWNANITNIYNRHIASVIYQVQKLQRNLKSKNAIIMRKNDFEVLEDKDIISQIETIKNEHINYIKTHADCIPEYHLLIINLKNYNIINEKDK
jgi:hypothetical protein